MKEKTVIRADEKTKIFSRRFSSVPMTYEFTAKPVGTGELSGEIGVEITQTLFRKKSLSIPLQVDNVVKATLWDTFMDVYITADVDVEVTMPYQRMSAKPIMLGLVVLFIATLVILVATWQ
jgi:hypothetical protein